MRKGRKLADTLPLYAADDGVAFPDPLNTDESH